MAIDFKILRDGKHFSCSANGGAPFLVGVQVPYHDRVGLENDGTPIAESVKYRAADYEPVHGFWADFIAPTAAVESNSSFLVVNTYDRAAFTFGFPQFAAHEPDGDFIRYFRFLLQRAEAQNYFPDLIVKNGHIHWIHTNVDEEMENAQSTQKLMSYLNESPTIVDDNEVLAAAKFIHWTQNYREARDIQVLVAVDVAQRFIRHADTRLKLDGRPADQCCVIFDILHQGRAGTLAYKVMASALADRDPLARLLEIGASDYPERVRTLTQKIAADPGFAAHSWSSSKSDFAAIGGA